MKIACVATGWYPEITGGLEKYVYGMTKELLRSGDVVDLFVTGNPQLDSEQSRAYSIGQPADRLWKRLLDARSAFASCFRPPYDVVNLHFAMNALPLIPFIDHQIPRVVHFHGPWGAESRAEGGGALSAFLKECLERFVYRRADQFIVLSSAFRDVLSAYGVDRERISVIPMGIDTAFFRPALDRCAARKALGWQAEPMTVFTARRLVNRVGLMELLEAAAIVRANGERIIFKIAGKGPLHDRLVARSVELGLTDCVDLLGFISENDLVQCYQAADVTVLPTQSLEGFGTIISESLACGTPVIVTPVGGMPEAVEGLDSRLVTNSSKPEDIAHHLVRAARNRHALPSSKACRAFAQDRFDWRVVYARIRKVFVDANDRLFA